MEKTNITIQSVDYEGNDISITCEGVDNNKLAHFGGLDIYVKAARTLISSASSPISFPEKNGDYLIQEKVVGLLLNEIGEFLREDDPNYEYLEGVSNIEMVHDFIKMLDKNKDLVNFLKEDDAAVRKHKKEIEDEENSFKV